MKLPAHIPNLEITCADGSDLVMGRPGTDTPGAAAALAVTDSAGTTALTALTYTDLARLQRWITAHLDAIHDT